MSTSTATTKYVPISSELFDRIRRRSGGQIPADAIVETYLRDALAKEGTEQASVTEAVTAVANSPTPEFGSEHSSCVLPVISNDLESRIRKIIDKYWGGKLYMKIPHPAFDQWPANYGYERWDVIKPHVSNTSGTALDVGAHFGSFSHLLEDSGFQVTAVEICQHHAQIMRDIRDLAGKKFQVVEDSIFELRDPQFNVVLALNVFHHFLKKEKDHDLLVDFLKRLRCETIIFQAHDINESQMQGAFANYAPAEFADFVRRHAGLKTVECIRDSQIRKIFKIG